MTAHPLQDQLRRPIHDLRISVTDRCNFRCSYCMPKEVFGEDYAFLPASGLLTFAEILRLTKLFVSLGVSKIRLTGGEPLMRQSLPELVAGIRAIRGVEDMGLTTNGVLLGGQAMPLYAAGLRRLNVSLDALEPELFGRMNGRGYKPGAILRHIDYAIAAGFEVKVNMVVQRGVNESEIVPMAAYFKDRNITLRFIEFMDAGNDNGWSYEKVVTKKKFWSASKVLLCWKPWSTIISARWRSVMPTKAVRRRSALSLPYPNPSAPPARGPGCLPTASCIPACSHRRALISGQCSAAVRMINICWLPLETSGRSALTAIPMSGQNRPRRTEPRSACPILEVKHRTHYSAVERAGMQPVTTLYMTGDELNL